MTELLVAGLYLGDRPGIEKTPVNQLSVDCGGIRHDRHYGFTRGADGRTPQYPPDEDIRNTRQWSAISRVEAAAVARRMAELTKFPALADVDPLQFAAWIGANLCFDGVPVSQFPKGTRLHFPPQEADGATVPGAVFVVEDQNMPCRGPGQVIASKFEEGRVNYLYFPKAAMIDKETSRRGNVGVVEHAGLIACGDIVTVELYNPKTYSLPPVPEI